MGSISAMSRYIVFVVVAAFIGWLEFNSINEFTLDRLASRWPSTQGTIVGHELCSPVYACGLKYAYQVNGKNYVGQRISFTQAHLPKGWNEEKFIKWAAKEFQNGQSINVFYKHGSPETAALQTGVLADSYLSTIVIMAVAMLGLLFFGLRGLKQSWTHEARINGPGSS